MIEMLVGEWQWSNPDGESLKETHLFINDDGTCSLEWTEDLIYQEWTDYELTPSRCNWNFIDDMFTLWVPEDEDFGGNNLDSGSDNTMLEKIVRPPAWFTDLLIGTWTVYNVEYDLDIFIDFNDGGICAFHAYEEPVPMDFCVWDLVEE
jgi:hypothetical protein